MSDEPSDADADADPDLLAAEYALGVLPPERRRALEAQAVTDEGLARAIADWQARLAPLALALAPTPPPPAVWRRLALATGIEAERDARTWWRHAGFWRACTAASLAVAACLLVLLLRPAAAGPQWVAALSSPVGPGAIYLVRVAPDGRAVVVAAAPADTPSGRALELWALRPGAAAPSSLGLLPPGGQREFTLPAPAGTRLLVSQEPQGGSPTGQPTGPVVLSGILTGT